MQNIPEINFEEMSGRDGNIGIITLNRPGVLNALNHAMFLAISHQLSEWESADHIKAVVIKAAEGRAFCAGGDIRYTYERKHSGDANLIHFFRDEYLMNYHIYHYKKPYIALLDGITMGGGAGISINGSHRIGTDKLTFAMPETGIGFYPDVGATFFLSRLPYKMGFYLGLSGASISADDCLAAGLIDAIVKSADFPDILYQLADHTFSEEPNQDVSHIIKSFAMTPIQSQLFDQRNPIAICFARDTIEEIIDSLEHYPNDWCLMAAKAIKKQSPTSLKVTLKALQKSEILEFDECMKMEYRLTSRFLERHDFFEGIRATLIDKDRQPRWNPATLHEVSGKSVNAYFDPLEQELF